MPIALNDAESLAEVRLKDHADSSQGARIAPPRPVTPSSAEAATIGVRSEPTGKRLLDIALSVAMLIASAPLWILVALAIKVEDGGPIFYRQKRWGRAREPIQILKFRSMVANSDDRYGLRQARNGDHRVTRVGKLLRSRGLDELPQILSILKGDMSFVGPRPLAIGEIVEDGEGDRVIWESLPGFAERLRVRPGLTSLATIYLPKDAHPRRKFCYDRIYVRRQSLALDVGLIAISFWVSFAGRWETRDSKT